MKILFLTLGRIVNINNRGIYSDLLNYFNKQGHDIFVVFPTERRYRNVTSLNIQNNVKLLSVKTLNIQKTNVIEKISNQLDEQRSRFEVEFKEFKEIKDLVHGA